MLWTCEYPEGSLFSVGNKTFTREWGEAEHSSERLNFAQKRSIRSVASFTVVSLPSKSFRFKLSGMLVELFKVKVFSSRISDTEKLGNAFCPRGEEARAKTIDKLASLDCSLLEDDRLRLLSDSSENKIDKFGSVSLCSVAPLNLRLCLDN